MRIIRASWLSSSQDNMTVTRFFSSYIKADRYKKPTRHDADYKDRDVVCLCTGANLEQGPILVLCVHPESQDPIGSALVHICRNEKTAIKMASCR